jgi:hypothetical protein
VLIKTSELIGLALDWAVAQAEGVDIQIFREGDELFLIHTSEKLRYFEAHYSTDWEQAGPIIEQMLDEDFVLQKANWGLGMKMWRMRHVDSLLEVQYGKTTLIAAMRCYVATKFSDQVDVPEELINGA